MNLIKRHKGLAIVGGLSLILLILIIIIFARIIFGKNSERFNNLVKLDAEITNKLISETKELEEIADVKVRTEGKTIYLILKYQEGTKISKAKEIANKTLEYYDDEVKNCYDFGYFLVENIEEKEEDEEENKGFIITGTKHPDRSEISWTKE